MKLLFLVQNFRQGWGGAPESVRLMARRLAPWKISCDVYDSGRLHRAVENLAVLPASSAGPEMFRATEIAGYSTVLQVGPWQHPWRVGAILSRLAAKQRYLYLPRGGLADIEFEGRHALKKLPYLALIERRFVARADAVIFSSEAERRKSSRIAGVARKECVVPDFFEWPQQRIPASQTSPSAPRPLTLGFLGEISPRKGLLPLVEGMALWAGRQSGRRPLRLRIGGGPRRGAEAYLARIREISSRVENMDIEFLGPINHSDRARFYAETDLFFAPSLFESYGLIVLEALASGCAIASAPNLGVLEYLPESLNVTVLADVSPAAIAATVDRAIDQADTRGGSARDRSAADEVIETINSRASRSWRTLLKLA